MVLEIERKPLPSHLYAILLPPLNSVKVQDSKKKLEICNNNPNARCNQLPLEFREK